MNKGIKPVRKTQNIKRPYLLTVERFGHWQYVAMVRDMWSFCAELVHCQAVIKQLSGSPRAVVGQSSAGPRPVLGQSSASPRAVVRQSSGSFQAVFAVQVVEKMEQPCRLIGFLVLFNPYGTNSWELSQAF